MKSVSIGYIRDDGDFAILATLNNKDGHLSNRSFSNLAIEIAKHFMRVHKAGLISILEREDTPDYVEIENLS